MLSLVAWCSPEQRGGTQNGASETTRAQEDRRVQGARGYCGREGLLCLSNLSWLCHSDINQIKDQIFTRESLQLTSRLLTLNPEYYTIWNHRRRILQHQFAPPNSHDLSLEEQPGGKSPDDLNKNTLELLMSDLSFVFSLLRKFPKCYWIWNHRLWLIQQASTHLPTPTVRKLWEGELLLVSKMLSLDNRNFHGWGYRRIVVAALERPQLRDESVGASMTKDEFDYTTRMIRTSMSNFSAWHNRSVLIARLLDEQAANDEDRRKLLDEGTSDFHSLFDN